MAIGRLLFPKLNPHFSSRGFVPLTRTWLSSSLDGGWIFERVPDSNKDIGQKRTYCFSLGGILSNLKQKVTLRSSMVVSSADVTATKVVSLQDVAGNKNCIPPSSKKGSTVSKDSVAKVDQGKLQKSDQKKSPLNILLNMFINPDQEKIKLPLRFVALSNSNSSMSTGESCCDAADEHGLFGKTASTLRFRSSRKNSVPVAVTRDLRMKKMMDSLKLPTEADANLWNPNGDQSPNKVMLRFLRKTLHKKDIVEHFSEFGAILDIQELPSFEGCIYKDALLTFETNSAAKNALKKAVVMIKNSDAVIEATSQENMVERIHIPDLIGDSDVPIALVKEPTRTVKIHPLDHDVSSDQIKEALRFCKSNISKLIFGSSKTSAFVEFETEDDKEKSLTTHSITLLNKQVFISRIDIPRTTVARISNFSQSATNEIQKLCGSYGKIKLMCFRGKGIMDVHFAVSEWPNMVTILNSLNGKEIDGMKLVVQPAITVIPPEILTALWKDPQGKRYVLGLIQKLVREIDQPLGGTSSQALFTDLLK